MTLQLVAQQALFLFGLGFLGANIKAGADILRYRQRRNQALLTWPGSPRPYYRLGFLLGAVQGLLLAALLVLRRPLPQLFGLGMMIIYFLCAAPLSQRIARGFYREGVWSDSGFVRWEHISGVAWRQEGKSTLLLISHIRNMAKRLQVPGHLYGQARKVLREQVKDHELHLGGTGLDLGGRDDERDAV